ncbi:MAG: Transcriptional regulator, TrmB [Parcubacteria group bacterium GW2011_GWA1_56_13]|nr:MAG: Transcriptional regulator, TrmB [Parcubacteria group bacterium GW2011_GWA1_56_13]
MRMQVQKVIEQLGYTRDEAKVYLAALGLGESHVSDIAQKVRRPPSSVQVIINKLHKDGLMNFYVRKRYKYWVAENPTRLIARLREREDSVRSVMPQLEALQHEREQKPRIKIFEGVDEIRLLYDDMLETKTHILAIIPWDDWIRLLGRGFMEDFIEKRVKHYLHIRLLIPNTAVAAELRSRDASELRETRYVPDDAPIRTTVLLYGAKAAVVSLNRKLPTAVLIEDADVHETLSVFFEELWARSAAA